MSIICITIETNGNVVTEVNGVRGKSCKELTKQITEALSKGARVEEKIKPEYYSVGDDNRQQQHVHVRNW